MESSYTGHIALTEKENALLPVLAQQPDRAFSRAQLLSAVFEHRDSESAVDTYVHYLRRKLEPDLVQTVRGEGYRLGTPA
ncbi:winged helix-turn-helix domain-containing protein [Corynebacterium sp. UBA2622]|uniref:winged helix-turn-helix domain-containing protein n=1 Tax=Corynebacterium sp. UBA2622 TaxID=1946393 RepID=UPI0025B9A967|nr:winged helix-turn-helix domain-containing protein [Corynebacterium sp. UBA2622]